MCSIFMHKLLISSLWVYAILARGAVTLKWYSVTDVTWPDPSLCDASLDGDSFIPWQWHIEDGGTQWLVGFRDSRDRSARAADVISLTRNGGVSWSCAANSTSSYGAVLSGSVSFSVRRKRNDGKDIIGLCIAGGLADGQTGDGGGYSDSIACTVDGAIWAHGSLPSPAFGLSHVWIRDMSWMQGAADPAVYADGLHILAGGVREDESDDLWLPQYPDVGSGPFDAAQAAALLVPSRWRHVPIVFSLEPRLGQRSRLMLAWLPGQRRLMLAGGIRWQGSRPEPPSKRVSENKVSIDGNGRGGSNNSGGEGILAAAAAPSGASVMNVEGQAPDAASPSTGGNESSVGLGRCGDAADSRLSLDVPSPAVTPPSVTPCLSIDPGSSRLALDASQPPSTADAAASDAPEPPDPGGGPGISEPLDWDTGLPLSAPSLTDVILVDLLLAYDAEGRVVLWNLSQTLGGARSASLALPAPRPAHPATPMLSQ